jgi:predicted ATPase
MKHKPRGSKKPDGPSVIEEQRSRDALRYSSFQVQDFRGIRELAVEPLTRVNLIAGENNAGKTALLEAIFLHSAPFNPMVVTTVAGLRGIAIYKIEFGRMVQRPWSSLFSDLDESRQIRLSARDACGHTRTLVVKTTSDAKDVAQVRSISTHAVPNGQGVASSGVRTEILRWHYSGGGREEISLLFLDGAELKTYPLVAREPVYPGRFLGSRWAPNFPEIADQFGELEIDKKEQDLLRILRLMEPRLTRLSTILYGGIPMLHGDIGIGKLIPVAFLGDGLLRLTTIILWIIHTAGGILLIDEVDNGFHYSHLQQIWSAIAESAKQFNVQVFATTHSKECIVAAHAAFSQSFEYDFSLHRLERTDTAIRVVTYDKETLEAAIDAGFEVR